MIDVNKIEYNDKVYVFKRETTKQIEIKFLIYIKNIIVIYVYVMYVCYFCVNMYVKISNCI